MENTKITIIILSNRPTQFIDVLNRSVQSLKEEIDLQITKKPYSYINCRKNCDLFFMDGIMAENRCLEKIHLIPFRNHQMILVGLNEPAGSEILLPAEEYMMYREEFQSVLRQMIILCLEEKNDCLTFVSDRCKNMLKSRQVCTITVKGNRSIIQAGNRIYPVYCSLCRMIAYHNLYRWMLRASRAVLINPIYIDYVYRDEVHMKNGTVYYISRYYKSDFMEEYNRQS